MPGDESSSRLEAAVDGRLSGDISLSKSLWSLDSTEAVPSASIGGLAKVTRAFGGAVCGTTGVDTYGPNVTVSCPRPMLGRHVLLQRQPGSYNSYYATFCEVSVTGFKHAGEYAHE